MRPERMLALLCVALAGCSGAGGLRSDKPAAVAAPTTESIQAAQLASYVVAHSEYSSPLGRRNVLTGLVADEVVQAAPASPPRPAEAPVPAPR